METLKELAEWMEEAGTLVNGPAPEQGPAVCWSGGPDDPFAIFDEPCRCRVCEPGEGA